MHLLGNELTRVYFLFFVFFLELLCIKMQKFEMTNTSTGKQVFRAETKTVTFSWRKYIVLDYTELCRIIQTRVKQPLSAWKHSNMTYKAKVFYFIVWTTRTNMSYSKWISVQVFGGSNFCWSLLGNGNERFVWRRKYEIQTTLIKWNWKLCIGLVISGRIAFEELIYKVT